MMSSRRPSSSSSWSLVFLALVSGDHHPHRGMLAPWTRVEWKYEITARRGEEPSTVGTPMGTRAGVAWNAGEARIGDSESEIWLCCCVRARVTEYCAQIKTLVFIFRKITMEFFWVPPSKIWLILDFYF
jgi:hypothetical protein